MLILPVGRAPPAFGPPAGSAAGVNHRHNVHVVGPVNATWTVDVHFLPIKHADNSPQR